MPLDTGVPRVEYGFADSQTSLEVWSVHPLQMGEDDFMGKEPGKKTRGKRAKGYGKPLVALGSERFQCLYRTSSVTRAL